MEKMNQVSVSEFMNLTKTQMYDNAVEMVEKYNRLVDICNDSAERMAEFMAKDDINEFKKELQSKAPGEFKIQKLADIAVWADGKIRDGGYNEEKYNNDGATAYCHVKAHELWKIKEVVLEAVNRHNTYTNALNQDIADKEAKIELLEKGLEGRKEGYTALKELMDTKYISIDEHNKIIDQFKEEVKKLNKCIMNKNESINTGNEAIINLRKEIGAHEEENARLSDIIKNLRASNEKPREEQNQYKEFVDGLKKDLNYWKEAFETQATSLAEVRKLNDELVDTLNKSSDEVEKLEKQVEYLKKELDQTCTCKELDLKGHQSRETALVNALADKNEEIKKWKNKFEESRKETINRNTKILCLEVNLKRWKDIAEHNMNDTYKKEIARLEKQVEYLKKELDKTCTCKELDLKGHQSRETALVNALADKDDEIKELKEENSRLNARIKCDTEYWKNAFEAQSLDLADEKKHNKELNEVITELKEKRDKLKKECKNKNDIIRKAYTRYMDDVCENREEIMNECYKKLTKDDTGYTGFKQYTLRALETKKDEKEAKKFLSNAIDIIFYNKKAEEERKEETKKYRPSEIDKVTDLLKEEVDKKQIVDVGEGVETELGVSRELLDAAIKLMVAKGYHEYYRAIYQGTDATKCDLFHVLTIPSVYTEAIVKPENIKSLDFDIPCGSDSIE